MLFFSPVEEVLRVFFFSLAGYFYTVPVKPHEALDGKTPSEQAGITIEGDNKWLTLMKTSLSHKRYKESS